MMGKKEDSMVDNNTKRHSLDGLMSQVSNTPRLSTCTFDRPTATSTVCIMLHMDDHLSSALSDDPTSVSDLTLWLGSTCVDHKDLA